MANGDLYEIICGAGRDKTVCPFHLKGYCCSECNNARYIKRFRTVNKENKEENKEDESK